MLKNYSESTCKYCHRLEENDTSMGTVKGNKMFSPFFRKLRGKEFGTVSFLLCERSS